MMNDLQAKVFDYLTSGTGDTIERRRVLKCLTAEGVLSSESRIERTKEELDAFLGRNPTGACDAGIQRFKGAMGIAPEVPTTATMQIVVNLVMKDTPEGPMMHGGADGHCVPRSISYNARQGVGHTYDCGLVSAVLGALRDLPWVVGATYEDYTLNVEPFPSTAINR